MSTQKRDTYQVIIVGAGVGGAACALALAKTYGLRILLIERHKGPGNLNRGESLLPPVTALLDKWGALDRMRAAGARPVATMEFHHFRHGMVLDMPLSLPDVMSPYLVLPHPRIEKELVEAAQDTGLVDVCYSTQVVRLLFDGGRIDGVVLRREGQETEAKARVVIGADGAHSRVRKGLGIEMTVKPYNHGLFIVDVERRPGDLDILRTALHPDGGVLVVPGEDRVGLAALIHKKDEKPFKSGPVEKKFSLIEHRSPLFEGRRPSKKGAHLYKLWRGHARSYSTRGAVLLGDAVHVINPVMAQGMTMAIEDAAALADFVGPVLASNGGAAQIDKSFEDYEAFRRPFNQAVIRHSHWMSCLFATNGVLGEGIVSLVRLIRGFSLCEHIQERVWASFARSPEFGG